MNIYYHCTVDIKRMSISLCYLATIIYIYQQEIYSVAIHLYSRVACA